MSKFQELQNRHLALLARYEQDKESKELLADAKVFVEQVVVASKEISNSRERNQLRANLRFWGAFIYDHTNVYPNLTLLPSEKKPALSGIAAGILGGIGILLVAFLIVYALLIWPRLRSSLQSGMIAQKTMNAQSTEIVGTLTAHAMGLMTQTRTPTPPPTVTHLPTATPTVGLFIPTPTSPPPFSPTPPGTPPPFRTPIIIIPVTGGLGTNIEYDQATCSSRTLSINIFDPFSTGEPVTVTLSRSGTGEVVAHRVVSEDENGYGSIQFALNDPLENRTYLLHVKNPVVQFDMMILQFLSNCTRNNTIVTLANSMLNSEPPFDPQVVLFTWGASYTEPFWLAKLTLKNGETGIFWLVDMTDPDNPVTQPIEDTFMIKGTLCSATNFAIVETTGGIYKKQEFLLYSPMSFCPTDIP